MADQLKLTVPASIVQAVEDVVRNAVADLLISDTPRALPGFLDVDGAANFLASTPTAIRSLVKRHAIPFHKAPNGRLLFDRDELDAWVRFR